MGLFLDMHFMNTIFIRNTQHLGTHIKKLKDFRIKFHSYHRLVVHYLLLEKGVCTHTHKIAQILYCLIKINILFHCQPHRKDSNLSYRQRNSHDVCKTAWGYNECGVQQACSNIQILFGDHSGNLSLKYFAYSATLEAQECRQAVLYYKFLPSAGNKGLVIFRVCILRSELIFLLLKEVPAASSTTKNQGFIQKTSRNALPDQRFQKSKE